MPGGFTFNGIHSSNYCLAVLKIEDPLLPPTKDNKEDISGKDGAWDFGADYGARPITIDVALTAAARSNLKATIRQIAGWFNSKEGAKPLVFDDEPDKFYSARLAGNIPIDFLISAYSEFTITFTAFDPIAQGEEIIWQKIIDTGKHVINNPGSYETRPIITITALAPTTEMLWDVCLTGGYDPVISGAITNPIVKVGTKAIKYIGVLWPGDSLVLDCASLNATFNGSNAMAGIIGEFPVLGPGDNNLSMTDETSTYGGEVKLQYRGRWL